METTEKSVITVAATVNEPIKKIWEFWNDPECVVQWNTASPEWHTPAAKNDLREGGEFLYRMEAKDGSFGFDFGGVYTKIEPDKQINYTMGDGRKAEVSFEPEGNAIRVTIKFEAENTNPIEMRSEE